MDNISIQVTRTTGGSVLMNNNVIYDTVIETDGDISYDTGTGVVTLSEIGQYYIYWWVAVQASQSTNGLVFELVSSQSDEVEGSSPIKADQPIGFAVIDVATAPITLSIQNNSNGTIYYSSAVNTTASLMVVKIAETTTTFTPAYGGLINDTTTTLTLPAGVNVTVPMNNEMTFSDVTYTGDTVVTNIAGDYRASYMINFAPAADNIQIQCGVMDGTGDVVAGLFQSCTLSTQTSTMISCESLLTLQAGFVLQLFVSSIAGGEVSLLEGERALLSLDKISID